MRFLLQTLQTDRFQIAWHARIECSQRDRLAVDHLQNRDGGRIANEGSAAGEQGVEDCAEGIDVGGSIHQVCFAGGLFGGHVAGGAEHLAGLGHGNASGVVVGTEAFGEAEVGDSRGAARR